MNNFFENNSKSSIESLKLPLVSDNANKNFTSSAINYAYTPTNSISIPTSIYDSTTKKTIDKTYPVDSTQAKLYSEASKVAVKIEAFSNTGVNGKNNLRESEGTGFFIDGQGDIATAYHVFDNYSQIFVSNNIGQTFVASVKSVDPKNDLAILHINVLNSPYPNLSTQKLQSNQNAYTFGYPLGTNNLTLSNGIFKNYSTLDKIDPQFPLMPGQEANQQLGQVALKTQEGNSGGPVFDGSGNVLGIVDFSNFKNITEFIPVQKLQNMIQDQGNYTFNSLLNMHL